MYIYNFFEFLSVVMRLRRLLIFPYRFFRNSICPVRARLCVSRPRCAHENGVIRYRVRKCSATVSLPVIKQ